MFWEVVDSHFGKLVFIACSLGLVFGLGFVVGQKSLRISEPVPSHALQTLAQKEKTYEKVQNALKLTYYKELVQRPKTDPEPSKSPTLTDSRPSSARMAEALAHVLGNDTPGSVQQVIEQSLPASTGSPYAIQVASFPNKESAEAMMQQMQTKGYQMRLVQADIPGKGVVYRLRIHGFQTREEAENYQQQNHIVGIAVAQ